MIRRPPRSTLFPSRRSSDLVEVFHARDSGAGADRRAPRRRRPSPQFTGLRPMSYFLSLLYKLERLMRSEEHTSELQSRLHLVCRLLLEKKKNSLVCSAETST